MMKYISIYDSVTGKRLAYLQNAYDIGYTLELNALWTARFSLPQSDPKRRHCRYFNFVDIWDGERYVGLFRIMPTASMRGNGGDTVTYECEHVLATLMDDVLLGWHQIGNLGVYTDEVIGYILSKQTAPRWTLGACDFRHQYLYGWENENLLTALFSVPNCFAEAYRWEFDTSQTPWVLSLKAPPNDTKAGIRYHKNMLGVEKSVDPTNICTRLYPFGYGEGENALHIAKLNDGRKYLDADTQNKYGVISRIWIDGRYQDEQSLFDAATAMLERLKEPQYSYSITGVHAEKLALCLPGDMVRVTDREDELDLHTRIISVSKDDVTGAPNTATIVIANAPQDIAGSVADLADRQRVAAAYSQGAVSLFSDSFYDNCSTQYPATMRFYVPENAVHVNQVILNAKAASFRGYTQATQGGGNRSDTTSSGGGAYTSTEAGGGSYGSTEAGGGSNNTSEATTLQPSNTVAQDDGGYGAASHNHAIPRGMIIAKWENGEASWGASWTPSGAHSHGAHSHNVQVPTHSHNVTVPQHGHSVSVPAHLHSFSLPNHTHAITYGIYLGTTANQLQLRVDDRLVGTFGGSIADVNIVEQLSKDDAGRIQRGWHTITITPNALTRVECDLSVQLFANSRGGGQF
jgi:phage minor structural protein